jgi:hypothetical protein
MKILSSEIVTAEIWIEVTVLHKGKKLHFSITTVDGKVGGEMKNNFATSYLPYFHDTPKKLQEKHFNLVKEYIEKNYK